MVETIAAQKINLDDLISQFGLERIDDLQLVGAIAHRRKLGISGQCRAFAFEDNSRSHFIQSAASSILFRYLQQISG